MESQHQLNAERVRDEVGAKRRERGKSASFERRKTIEMDTHSD